MRVTLWDRSVALGRAQVPAWHSHVELMSFIAIWPEERGFP